MASRMLIKAGALEAFGIRQIIFTGGQEGPEIEGCGLDRGVLACVTVGVDVVGLPLGLVGCGCCACGPDGTTPPGGLIILCLAGMRGQRPVMSIV